jgi:hypothetical protein
MNIKQFRAIYPEYRAASDETIPHKLHLTFYPNLTYESYLRSFLSVEKKIPSFILSDLYLKRSDAYLKEGNWHRAAVEFQRVVRGFPGYPADRWREMGPTRDGQNYIDMQTFDDARKDSIKLWIKEVRGSGDSGGPYSLLRFELNCQLGRIRTLSFAKYDESGELTSSHDGGVWQAIAPETLGETLSNGACGAR